MSLEQCSLNAMGAEIVTMSGWGGQGTHLAGGHPHLHATSHSEVVRVFSWGQNP